MCLFELSYPDGPERMLEVMHVITYVIVHDIRNIYSNFLDCSRAMLSIIFFDRFGLALRKAVTLVFQVDIFKPDCLSECTPTYLQSASLIFCKSSTERNMSVIEWTVVKYSGRFVRHDFLHK